MLWVAIIKDIEDGADIRNAHVLAHREFLAANGAKIALAGAMLPDVGENSVGGMWLLNVADKAEALDLIKADPFFVQGLRSEINVYAWGTPAIYENAISTLKKLVA